MNDTTTPTEAYESGHRCADCGASPGDVIEDARDGCSCCIEVMEDIDGREPELRP